MGLFVFFSPMIQNSTIITIEIIMLFLSIYYYTKYCLSFTRSMIMMIFYWVLTVIILSVMVCTVIPMAEQDTIDMYTKNIFNHTLSFSFVLTQKLFSSQINKTKLMKLIEEEQNSFMSSIQQIKNYTETIDNYNDIIRNTTPTILKYSIIYNIIIERLVPIFSLFKINYYALRALTNNLI